MTLAEDLQLNSSARDTAPPLTTYEQLRLAALSEITNRNVDSRDVRAVEQVVRSLVTEYQRRSDLGQSRRLADPAAVVQRLMRSITKAGPFQKYVDDPTMSTDVMFYGDQITFTGPDGRQHVDEEPTCEAELLGIVQRLLADAGASVDLENPIVVKMVLGNRVRLSASIPPVSDRLDGTMRVYRAKQTTLAELVGLGAITPLAANVLTASQRTQVGVLLTGGPSSGKSTALQAMLLAIPSTTTIRIVQEVRELAAPHLPGGRWSPEAGDLTIRDLIKRALQFAPRALAVGETLGAEAFELLKAGNAGCSFLTTLHANSAQLGMQSLVSAALMAGSNVSSADVRQTFSQLIDFVIHCEAEPVHLVPEGGRQRRQVMEICVVPPQIAPTGFVLEPIFRREDFGQPLEFVGHHFPQELERRINRALPNGMTLRDITERGATL